MDEQVAAIRRELRGRIKAADKIETQRRFPEFAHYENQTEQKIERQYLTELRLQVGGLHLLKVFLYNCHDCGLDI